MRTVAFKGFRIVDAGADFFGSVLVEDGRVARVVEGVPARLTAEATFDGRRFPAGAFLTPAFVDLHAHFREPAFPADVRSDAETLESASLAAVAGGFVTAVCMANARPAIDSLEKALALRGRAEALGLVDLFPAMSLTKNMEGAELSGIADLPDRGPGDAPAPPLLVSEDGRDVADDDLFLAAMGHAGRLGIPVSCHCDLGDSEGAAVRRAIALGERAGCRVHVAHVSTKGAVDAVREAKARGGGAPGFSLSCEATPHHAAATLADAKAMGADGRGRVNPPLASAEDRAAVAEGLLDGTVDAVATDHAPHPEADKAAGAPGFVGLETAFSACLALFGASRGLRLVSALLSANPARILGLSDRGRVAEGLRADLVVADAGAAWRADPSRFRSRGRCSPFEGREMLGRVLTTMNAGRLVYQGVAT